MLHCLNFQLRIRASLPLLIPPTLSMEKCDMCDQDICDECGGCACPGNECSCDASDDLSDDGDFDLGEDLDDEDDI